MPSRGKTIMFIDNSNIFHGSRQAGWRIDAKKLHAKLETEDLRPASQLRSHRPLLNLIVTIRQKMARPRPRPLALKEGGCCRSLFKRTCQMWSR